MKWGGVIFDRKDWMWSSLASASYSILDARICPERAESPRVELIMTQRDLDKDVKRKYLVDIDPEATGASFPRPIGSTVAESYYKHVKKIVLYSNEKDERRIECFDGYFDYRTFFLNCQFSKLYSENRRVKAAR